MSTETLDLARALLARPSVTPADEGCQQLIVDRLAPLGFVAEAFRCGEVSNVWLRRGTGAPLVVFAGHTDVVPPGPLGEWHTDPFVPTVKDGRLHARGAADMKTSIAAFVVAAERLVAAHPAHPGSLALLLTSDEEGPSVDGTVRVVEALKARGLRIDYCIVGEPTSAERFGDTIKNGRRGTLTGRLVVKGIQGHVAYPHLARNPVHGLAPVIAELAATAWDEGNEHFPPTTWQVSNLHAGTGAMNIIPGEARLDFNFRFSTASTVDGLKARVHAALDRHGLDYRIEWILGGRPFLTPRGRLVETLARVVKQVSGAAPEISTTGGTSDGRFIAEICPEVVEFGPVNRSIHQVNESVAIAEMEPLAEIYRLACEDLLGVK
ncbi:MAG TPA: succinyl-diaminopimelate desuccinylase [Usitatibacteraceae bacterium]|nr:succinyl-diaminopimelate desuccinylase [Usitatibacteraceae bacterium]